MQTRAKPDRGPGPENAARLGLSLVRGAHKTTSPSSSISITGATPNGILVNPDLLRGDTDEFRQPNKILNCNDVRFVNREAVISRDPSAGLVRLTDIMTGSDRGDAEEAGG